MEYYSMVSKCEEHKDALYVGRETITQATIQCGSSSDGGSLRIGC